MTKLFFTLCLLSVYLYAQIPSMNLPSPTGGQNGMMAFKVLVTKPPHELDPEMSVIVGTIFSHGDKELGVNKNIEKALQYYQYAGESNVSIGYLLSANIYAEKDDFKRYVQSMEKVISANDAKLSVPAGLQLASVWKDMDHIDKSVEVLRYVADRYQDSRAQFLVGYSLVTGEFRSKELSTRDGEFYIYQACNNPLRDEAVKRQCSNLNLR